MTEEFRVTEGSAFALGSGSLKQLQARCRSEREFARVLADGRYYNGAHFRSLAERFGVSVEAMAIRIEELDLATIAS